jgi:parallel beta-helix repeat protein
MLYVGGSGDGNYSNIKDAINAADDRDTVYVTSGTYYENIVIDKSIDLIGNDKENTIIDGGGLGDVIRVIVDHVNISGFTVKHSEVNLDNITLTYAGVYTESSYVNVSYCDIIECQLGILLKNTSYSEINNCEISNNTGGINFYNSSYNQISSCMVLFNDPLFGVSLQKSNNNTIFNNNISFNDAIGLGMSESSNNTVNRVIFWGNNGSGAYVTRTIVNPCRNNIFFENNFGYNKLWNALDNCDNELWDNGVLGNYWSDFDESGEGAWDNNSDKIVDVPYAVPYVGNRDNYPLIRPIKIEIYDQTTKKIIINVHNPLNHSTIKGVVTLEGNVSCLDGVIETVKIKIDKDGVWQLAAGIPAWQIEIDTNQYDNGEHHLYVYAQTEEGGYSIKQVTVKIENPSGDEGGEVPGFEIFLFLIAFLIMVLVVLPRYRFWK